jgi:hypothetical protein
MPTALQSLLQSAPVCKPIKADLRASTVTLEWPPNVLVQRAPYVVVPLAEALQAYRDDQLLVAFKKPSDKRRVRRICDDLDFQVDAGSTRWTLYFYRIPGQEYPKPPCTWWGSEKRTDLEGKTWTRDLGEMVMDNFGDLVSVETGRAP